MIKDLTSEQKHILLEEGTEPPGTSPLNYEKREGEYCCAGCGTKLFESKKNMKVEVDGHLFLRHCQTFLKQKLII
jgi:peptide-methionine (R)-S-oxide reductase